MSNFMTLLTALLGSAGFALLFNVRKQLLPLAALEGFDGKTMKLNAFRLDKKADGRLLLYALNPTLCESFHRPAFFL